MSRSPSLTISKFPLTSIVYKWPIYINNSTCSNGRDQKSPIFPADTEVASVRWRIRMISEKSHPSASIGLWLYGSSKHISSVRASFSFDLQTGNEKSIVTSNYEVKTHNFDAAKGWTEIGGGNLYFSDLCLANKQVTIQCTIDIFEEYQDDTPDVSLFYNIPNCNLWQDLENLLSTGKNADITLVGKTKSQKLKVHKAILMARSPVFNAMFSNQLKESQDKTVVINDLDFDVLDEMVRYIYTGKASNLSEVADRLLMAADKYDLPILRVMCEQEMGANLSVENAAQTLILADRHQASQLKKHTLSFIKHHARSVLATDGWQGIKTSHHNLLADVCQSLATLKPES